MHSFVSDGKVLAILHVKHHELCYNLGTKDLGLGGMSCGIPRRPKTRCHPMYWDRISHQCPSILIGHLGMSPIPSVGTVACLVLWKDRNIPVPWDLKPCIEPPIVAWTWEIGIVLQRNRYENWIWTHIQVSDLVREKKRDLRIHWIRIYQTRSNHPVWAVPYHTGAEPRRFGHEKWFGSSDHSKRF